MREYYVFWNGISRNDKLIGIVWLEDIEKIFRLYFFDGMPSEFRAELEALQLAKTIVYTFPSTNDTLEICNAEDLYYI